MAALPTVEPRKTALSREVRDRDQSSLGLKMDEARFPVLEYPRDNNEFPETDPGTRNTLLKLGGIGAFLNDQDIPRSRNEIEETNKKIEALRATLAGPLQILFVVDDTGSMKPFLESVAKTVEEIVKNASVTSAELKRNPDGTLTEVRSGRQVEIAVAYYNDSLKGKAPLGYEVDRLVEATADTAKRIPDKVKNHQLCDGGDYREDLFPGLIAAIKSANFEKTKNAQRLVILIGDHGDKSDEQDVAHRGENEVVKELLDPKRAPVILAVFQMVRPPGEDPAITAKDEESRKPLDQGKGETRTDREYRRLKDEVQKATLARAEAYAAWAFKTQMETIRDLLNSHKEEFGGITLGSYTVIENNNDVVRQAEELGKALAAEIAKAKSLQEKAEERLRVLNALQFHTRIEPRFVSLLETFGVKTEDVKKLPGVRIGFTGYAWRWVPGRVQTLVKPGTPQLRLRAFLSREEIGRLLTLLSPIEAAPDEAKALAVLQSMVKEGESWEQTVLHKEGLPAHSKLLKKPQKEVSKSASIEEIRGIRARIKTLRVLRDRPDDVRYFAISEGLGRVWCWVDYEDELP